jgi:hypothetical protein
LIWSATKKITGVILFQETSHENGIAIGIPSVEEKFDFGGGGADGGVSASPAAVLSAGRVKSRAIAAAMICMDNSSAPSWPNMVPMPGRTSEPRLAPTEAAASVIKHRTTCRTHTQEMFEHQKNIYTSKSQSESLLHV